MNNAAMTEQERFDQMLRERTPPPEPPQFVIVKGSDQNAPMFPVAKVPEVTPYTGPDRVLLTDIRLSWTCVARLSLQFVLMSFLVAAFLAGIVAIIAGVFMGLAGSLHTMPPPPIR